MLKIKDNVGLKELEKYGYEYFKDWCCLGHDIYYKHVANWTSIEIDVRSGEIYQNFDDTYRTVSEEYIQDLIKDGLVEKVDDKW